MAKCEGCLCGKGANPAGTAAGGWLLGYLDEKLSKGSIIPSILLHGFGNFIMVLSTAF